MRQLHIGAGAVIDFVGKEVTIFFAPAMPGAYATEARFPEWKAKVKLANDDALIVEHAKHTIALSWDHIAGIQLPDR